jgi:hypothetical protein
MLEFNEYYSKFHTIIVELGKWEGNANRLQMLMEAEIQKVKAMEQRSDTYTRFIMNLNVTKLELDKYYHLGTRGSFERFVHHFTADVRDMIYS